MILLYKLQIYVLFYFKFILNFKSILNFLNLYVLIRRNLAWILIHAISIYKI